mgnify:CR=1 FL=1
MLVAAGWGASYMPTLPRCCASRSELLSLPCGEQGKNSQNRNTFSLGSARVLDYTPFEMAEAATFEFFKDIPKDDSVSEEAQAYYNDFNECGGLIPAAAMPHMLGVSRQRWYVIKKDFNFKVYKHFDKEFVSYPVAIEFCKVQRPNKGPASPAKAIKAIMADLSD